MNMSRAATGWHISLWRPSRHFIHGEVLSMRIGILGSGLMGGKLGTIFTRAGHDVVFSYERSPKKLERLLETRAERLFDVFDAKRRTRRRHSLVYSGDVLDS